VFIVVVNKHSGQRDTCKIRGGGIISEEAIVNVFILLEGYFLVLSPSSGFHVGLTSRTFGNWFFFHLQAESV